MENSNIRRSRRAEKRLIELEKWKKSKNEAKELMKKMTKPPFRPVGKSAVAVKENIFQGSIIQKSVKKSTLQTTRFKKPIQSRYSSTPLLKNKITNPIFFNNQTPPIIKPFIKAEIANSAKIDTYSLSSTSNEKVKSRVFERKSVQFKDSIEKISLLPSPNIDAASSLLLSPKPDNGGSNKVSADDIRRRSNAGRTPFSCTTSRSGSTPGRRNYQNSTIQQFTADETQTTPVKTNNPTELCTPKSSIRRKSKSGKCLLRWSVSKSSIIPRDPYLLRSQTPIFKSELSHNFDKTDLIDFNHSAFLNKSKKKKNMQVSFGNIVVNTINEDHPSNKSPTFDDTFCMLNKTPQINETLHNSVTFSSKCMLE